MDKRQLTGLNLGCVFNSRGGCVGAMHLCCFETKLPNLMLKIRPKQFFGSLPLDITLPNLFDRKLFISYFVNSQPAGLKLVKVKIKF
jgi:hypothetical protein